MTLAGEKLDRGYFGYFEVREIPYWQFGRKESTTPNIYSPRTVQSIFEVRRTVMTEEILWPPQPEPDKEHGVESTNDEITDDEFGFKNPENASTLYRELGIQVGKTEKKDTKF